jgi:hypothetical protein
MQARGSAGEAGFRRHRKKRLNVSGLDFHKRCLLIVSPFVLVVNGNR